MYFFFHLTTSAAFTPTDILKWVILNFGSFLVSETDGQTFFLLFFFFNEANFMVTEKFWNTGVTYDEQDFIYPF